MATRIREKAKARQENADKRPRAIARYVRISSSKAGIVCDLIRGKKADDALAILMYAFAPGMMSLLTPDGEVIALGARVLRIEAFAEVGYAASIVAYGACVGAGDTRVPSLLNFGSMWVVRILPAIFLTRRLGLVGFWYCMAFELTFRGAAFLIRLARGKWLKI